MHLYDMTWSKCCQNSIKKLSIENMKEEREIVSDRTIQRWHRKFRMNDESFIIYHRGKDTIPIFDWNPEFRHSLISFTRSNISTFNLQSVHEFIHTTALPKLLQIRIQELKNNNEIVSEEEYKLEDLLNENGLTSVCPRTVCTWMRILGFRCKPKTKTFYVDGHEAHETDIYRKVYICTYLCRELWCHRWIQLPKKEVIMLEKKYGSKFIQCKDGYEYINKHELTMIEFHVDSHDCLRPYYESIEFGGNLSIRKREEDKPLVIFGQDECIFKQYQFNNKQWYLPDGTCQILPKDEGLGIMYSSFVSRDFGYGLDLTPDDMMKVNKKRESEKYCNEEAAKAVQNGYVMKKTYCISIHLYI